MASRSKQSLEVIPPTERHLLACPGKAGAREPRRPRHLPCALYVLNEPMRIVPAQHQGNGHIVAMSESQVAPSVGRSAAESIFP
jgi:hypothetical protein